MAEFSNEYATGVMLDKHAINDWH